MSVVEHDQNDHHGTGGFEQAAHTKELLAELHGDTETYQRGVLTIEKRPGGSEDDQERDLDIILRQEDIELRLSDLLPEGTPMIQKLRPGARFEPCGPVVLPDQVMRITDSPGNLYRPTDGSLLEHHKSRVSQSKLFTLRFWSAQTHVTTRRDLNTDRNVRRQDGWTRLHSDIAVFTWFKRALFLRLSPGAASK